MRDRDLDNLLDMAARARPSPSPELMDRVLADALANLSEPAPLRPMQASRKGWLGRLAEAFGGGPVLAGVCSSVVLGLAVGYMNPVSLDYLTGGLASAEAVEFFPSADFLMTEG